MTNRSVNILDNIIVNWIILLIDIFRKSYLNEGESRSKNITCDCPNDCQIKSFNPQVTYAEIPIQQITATTAHRYGISELEQEFLEYNNISISDYLR